MGAYALLVCNYLDWLTVVVPDGREGAVVYEGKYTTRQQEVKRKMTLPGADLSPLARNFCA
jgi:hypothetical protein